MKKYSYPYFGIIRMCLKRILLLRNSGGRKMNTVIMITQLFFTLVIGMYFLTKLRGEKSDMRTL